MPARGHLAEIAPTSQGPQPLRGSGGKLCEEPAHA